MEIVKTLGYITNDNGKFDICVVDHLGQLWLATYDRKSDDVDTLCTVRDVEDAIEKANKQFSRSQTEYVLTSTKIEASDDMVNDEILFTPAALLDFLRQVDELADKDISIDDTGSGVNITIGDSTYAINSGDAEEVEVEPEVVDEVAEINETTYEELDDVEYTELDDDVVEGGIISEALKTLAVGGMVRLTSKLLGKDVADTLLK